MEEVFVDAKAIAKVMVWIGVLKGGSHEQASELSIVEQL